MNQFYNAFDCERRAPWGKSEDYRSAFQIDRDRVLYTPTFRSMQSKTQVFWSGEYDFYRTRLTHSLEVAQIGKAICQWLAHSAEQLSADFYIDTDLVEATCLSHDIGHPPFGHAGEKTLNELTAHCGGFEGNAQTLRLLTERIFSTSRSGMNPSRAFLDGVLKYKTLWSELKKGEQAPKNHFLYDEQVQFLDWVFDGVDFPIELTPGNSRDQFRSIECQIMDWADDTAYSLNDLSDSARAGFLSLRKVEEWAGKQDLTAIQNQAIERLLDAIRNQKVELMSGRKIGQYIQSVGLKEENNFMSAVTNRYRYRLALDEAVKEELEVYKKLTFEVVFLSAELNQLEYKGDYMLKKLWSVFHKRYVEEQKGLNLLPPSIAEEMQETTEDRHKERLLCDFLASLSDAAASRLYRRLFVSDYGSIGDLIS